MKKFIVLGSILGALVLTGVGCVGKTPTEEIQVNTTSESSAQPASDLPASKPANSADTPVSSNPGPADSSAPTPPPSEPEPTPQPTPAPQPERAQVVIANFFFVQASLTVKVGTIVKWTNDDQFSHSIKSEDGRFQSSMNLNTGNSYEVKFDKPGVYNYHCGLHPSMRGTVIVE